MRCTCDWRREIDEPPFAKLLVGRVADVGDAIGVEHDPIAAAKRHLPLLVTAFGKDASTAPPVLNRSTVPSARIRIGG